MKSINKSCWIRSAYSDTSRRYLHIYSLWQPSLLKWLYITSN